MKPYDYELRIVIKNIYCATIGEIGDHPKLFYNKNLGFVQTQTENLYEIPITPIRNKIKFQLSEPKHYGKKFYNHSTGTIEINNAIEYDVIAIIYPNRLSVDEQELIHTLIVRLMIKDFVKKTNYHLNYHNLFDYLIAHSKIKIINPWYLIDLKDFISGAQNTHLQPIYYDIKKKSILHQIPIDKTISHTFGGGIISTNNIWKLISDFIIFLSEKNNTTSRKNVLILATPQFLFIWRTQLRIRGDEYLEMNVGVNSFSPPQDQTPVNSNSNSNFNPNPRTKYYLVDFNQLKNNFALSLALLKKISFGDIIINEFNESYHILITQFLHMLSCRTNSLNEFNTINPNPTNSTNPPNSSNLWILLMHPINYYFLTNSYTDIYSVCSEKKIFNIENNKLIFHHIETLMNLWMQFDRNTKAKNKKSITREIIKGFQNMYRIINYPITIKSFPVRLKLNPHEQIFLKNVGNSYMNWISNLTYDPENRYTHVDSTTFKFLHVRFYNCIFQMILNSDDKFFDMYIDDMRSTTQMKIASDQDYMNHCLEILNDQKIIFEGVRGVKVCIYDQLIFNKISVLKNLIDKTFDLENNFELFYKKELAHRINSLKMPNSNDLTKETYECQICGDTWESSSDANIYETQLELTTLDTSAKSHSKKNTPAFARTICGHTYCVTCLSNLLIYKKKCAICRSNLTLAQSHIITRTLNYYTNYFDQLMLSLIKNHKNILIYSPYEALNSLKKKYQNDKTKINIMWKNNFNIFTDSHYDIIIVIDMSPDALEESMALLSKYILLNQTPIIRLSV
jgi:hypothetical protein